MHFYWRVKEELRFLGEKLVFHDPNLLREYNFWCQKNSWALTFSSLGYPPYVSPDFHFSGISLCLN